MAMAPYHSVINLPTGFKFHPTDDELLGYYLFKKTSGAPFMFDNFLPEEDLYGDKEPVDIWNAYGGQNLGKDEDLYFFTKLKLKDAKGTRRSRRIKSGTWKGENSGTEVLDPKNKKSVLGLKKSFSYKSLHNGHYFIMHEYSLHPSLVMAKSNSSTDCDAGQYVVCRIRKKPENKRKSASEDYDHDQDDAPANSCSHKIQRQLENNDQAMASSSARPVEFVANPTSLPQPDHVGLNGTIDHLPEGFSNEMRQFPDCDGDALMKDFSFLNTGATIQSLTAQQSGSHQYACTQQSAVNEERACDDSHTRGLTTHVSENTNTGLSDKNIRSGITNDQTDGQFGTENAELNNFLLDENDELDKFFDGLDDVCKLIDFDELQFFTTQPLTGMESTTTATTEVEGKNDTCSKPPSNMVTID